MSMRLDKGCKNYRVTSTSAAGLGFKCYFRVADKCADNATLKENILWDEEPPVTSNGHCYGIYDIKHWN